MYTGIENQKLRQKTELASMTGLMRPVTVLGSPRAELAHRK